MGGEIQWAMNAASGLSRVGSVRDVDGVGTYE